MRLVPPIRTRSEEPPLGGACSSSERERTGPLAFSLNKRKALEAAQKYVQKGQLEKALKEYQKHLKTDPEDTNARLKLGDLHLKRKDAPAAIEAYSQVAQQFSRSGFDAKAVAIYKQILKVDANCLDARIKLGDHFQRMGLASEALRELQEAVNVCQERGLKREAFDLLKRVAELDPENLPNRLSLADLLAREGLAEESKEEFAKLLDQVERDGAADLIVRVSEQMLGCFPDSERAVIAYGQAKVKVGMAADAIARLGAALAQFDESIPVREALVQAYDATGDAEGKQTIYREIAELYKRRGNDEDARNILQRYVKVDFVPSDDDTGAGDGTDPGTGPLDFQAGAIDGDYIEPATPQKLSADPAASDDAGGDRYEELIAQAKVERDFGDPSKARAYAEEALRIEPGAVTARDILDSVDSSPSLELSLDDPAPAEAAAPPAPSEPDEPADVDDDGTLPDIELVLFDEADPEDVFGSVDPPPELELPDPLPEADASAPNAETTLEFADGTGAEVDDAKSAAPDPEPAFTSDEDDAAEFEIDIDDDLDVEIEVDIDEADLDAAPAEASAAPAATDAETGAETAAASAPDPAPDETTSRTQPDAGATMGRTWAEQSSWVAKTAEAAEAIFSTGLLDQAKILYEQILEKVPNHPQAMVRLGEIAEQQGGDPGDSARGLAAPEPIPDVAEPSTAPDDDDAFALDGIDVDIDDVDLESAAEEPPAPAKAGDSQTTLESLEPPEVDVAAPASDDIDVDDFFVDDEDEATDAEDDAALDDALFVDVDDETASTLDEDASREDAGEVSFADVLADDEDDVASPGAMDTEVEAALDVDLEAEESVLELALEDDEPALEPSVEEEDDIVSDLDADAIVADAIVADDEADVVEASEVEEAEPIVEADVVDDEVIEAESDAAPALFDMSELVEDEAEEVAEEDEGGDWDILEEIGDESAASSGYQVGIQEVLNAFKKGVEEQVSNEDASAHYDLAIAYKEMGLVEEAIEQLEIVQNHGALAVEGTALLAECKVELGKPDEAIAMLASAIGQTTDDGALVALRYDLAVAFVAAERPDDALAQFQKVAELDSNFREVQERIEELGG